MRQNRLLADAALRLGFAIQGFATRLLKDLAFDGGIREADLDVHQKRSSWASGSG